MSSNVVFFCINKLFNEICQALRWEPFSSIVEFRTDSENSSPDAPAMFQRHCTCLDTVRCFLDLFTVLRYLPQITAVRQQMEGQDDSKQVNFGK